MWGFLVQLHSPLLRSRWPTYQLSESEAIPGAVLVAVYALSSELEGDFATNEEKGEAIARMVDKRLSGNKKPSGNKNTGSNKNERQIVKKNEWQIVKKNEWQIVKKMNGKS